MTVERLIDLIAERQILSPKLVEKLRIKVAQSDQPMTAEALANFLVRKQHISQSQAKALLDAGMTFEPLPLKSEDEEAGGSSIFGPMYSSSVQPTRPSERDDDEEVFTLTPIDEEESDSPGDEPVILDTVMHAAPVAPAKSRASSLVVEPLPDPEELSTAVESSRKRTVGANVGGSSAPGLRKKKKKKQQWDSPVLLIGGGILLLLLICGLTVALILSRRGGAEKLAEARRYRDAGAFAQAITSYQEFIEGYPRDESRNKARMELALAKIRQAVEVGGDFEPALKIAQAELTALDSDKNFDQLPDARPELAELLPQIARGLANQAANTDDSEAAQRLAEQAVVALGLCRDAKFVSKDLQDEAAFAEVESELARVSRRQQTRAELAKSLEKMKAAIAGGDVRAAYQAHEELLKEHPELVGDPALEAAIVEASTAERDAIEFVAEEQAAETSERPTPWLAALATANRNSIASAPASGVFTARVDGAACAFDVTDGRLLWRRFAGFAAGLPPLAFDGQVLVFDSRFEELQNLDARSGKLRWRLEIGEPIASPLIVGDKVFLAAPSGKLYVVELVSGKMLGYLKFAQPLRVTPIVDRSGEYLILTGDHSSIYTISLADLKSTGVFHLGHTSGSITVPPSQVLGRLAVLENDGVATCRLRLLALDENSLVTGQITERRLRGLAASSPLVDARRLIVVTDRGELAAYDVSAAEDASALTAVATREPTSPNPLVRHTLLTPGAVWVGDTQLTKFAVLPTGNRLPVQSLDNSFTRSTFDHPLALFDKVIVHVRRIDDRAGVVVTAIDESSGRIFWSNELSVPPAASPIVDEQNRSIAMADVNGLVYRFGEAELRSRVQDQPVAPLARSDGPLRLDSGVDAGHGRGVFAAPGVGSQLVIYDPAAGRSPVFKQSLPSKVVCPLTRFGDRVLVPLEIGQVLALDPSAPQSQPIVFQPPIEPGRKVPFQPAGAVGDDGRRFVITDSVGKIFLVELKSDPTPHFELVAQQNVGAFPIVSPVVVLDETALAAIDGGQLVKFAIPSLENKGQTDLSGDVIWGPYRMGNLAILATARQELTAIKGDGSIAWAVPFDAGDFAGPPLLVGDSVLLTYKKGLLERRSLADGQVAATVDLEQPLAGGPVQFLDRIVVATHDGTLLVVQQP